MDYNQFVEQTLKLINPRFIIPELISISKGHLRIESEIINIHSDQVLHVIGLGKAASLEVKIVKDLLLGSIHNITLGKFISYTKNDHGVFDDSIIQFEGDHPNISQKNLYTTELFLKELESIKASDVVIFLISGGASAFLEKPISGVSFKDLNLIYNDLLGSGKNINEMNDIRKCLSLVKNGGLLNYIACEHLYQVINCDIPNEDLAAVSSGPLIFKELSLEGPCKYLDKFNIKLNSNTTNPNKTTKNSLQISGKKLVNNLGKIYAHRFITGKIYDCLMDNLIDDLISNIPKKLKQVHISGGEGTLVVPKGSGKGGRNTHFVLAMAHKVYQNPKNRNLKILGFGTDGTDGPTDAAGAYISYEIYNSLDCSVYLANFDSYNYFEQVGTLIKTGPTQANVMDIRFIWRD